MGVVGLLKASVETFPSGTGSESSSTAFSVVVDNLAFAKQVGIWGLTSSGWRLLPCSYQRSVPGDREVWAATLPETPVSAFDVTYTVAGATYWDNDGGANYSLFLGDGSEGTDAAALGPTVVVGDYGVENGTLTVDVWVKNFAFAKSVGMLYTTDGWATVDAAVGRYVHQLPSGGASGPQQVESWQVTASVGTGVTGRFAVFATMAGTTTWDNDFTLNYAF